MKENIYGIKDIFEKIKEYAGIVGLVISIVAMFISGKSYKLTLEQYNNSKIDIYIGEVDRDKQSMRITPYNNDIYLQLAEVYFPTKVNDDKQPNFVDNSDYRLDLSSVVFGLEKVLKAEVPMPIEKDEELNFKFAVPIIIKSNYIHNGINYNGRALYSLYFKGTISNLGQPSICIMSIVYEDTIDKRIDKDKDIYQLLDNIWDVRLKYFIDLGWTE